MSEVPEFRKARNAFHGALLERVLFADQNGVLSNSDSSQKVSIKIARALAEQLGSVSVKDRLDGQKSGDLFEVEIASFIKEAFLRLGHLRPGIWDVRRVGGRNSLEIARYEQFSHLNALRRAAASNPELAAALGNDYTITPDIVVVRAPESDERINANNFLVDASVAASSSLRSANQPLELLHASISCKWTLRSDRAQNARSEALNLIRNRKGRLPHIVVVTGEPMPSRLASLTLGTGDIDCVYHFALPELIQAIDSLGLTDHREQLDIMVDGKRLRDIADLPLDLAV